jgi:hypothetical protein
VRTAAKQRVEKLLEDAQIKLRAKRSQQASADIAEREAKIEAEIAPLARAVERSTGWMRSVGSARPPPS